MCKQRPKDSFIYTLSTFALPAETQNPPAIGLAEARSIHSGAVLIYMTGSKPQGRLSVTSPPLTVGVPTSGEPQKPGTFCTD